MYSIFLKNRFGIDSWIDEFFSNLTNDGNVFTDIYFKGVKSVVKKIDDENFEMLIELPGAKKENVEVSFKDDIKTLTLNVKPGGIYKEKLTKSWVLEKNTKISEAKLEDGLLMIKIQKVIPAEEKPQIIALK